jgi:flagellar protein FliO/FliZ
MNSALYEQRTAAARGDREVTRGDKLMWDIIYYLAIVLFLAVAMIAGAFAVRAYLGGTGPTQAFGSLFGPKPEKRVYVTEQYNIDGKRRLVLVRRDDVEHLIMTGGPVDVVIETGIAPPREPHPDAAGAAATVSSRGSFRA